MAGAEEAARESVRFDMIMNPNWTVRVYEKPDHFEVPFTLEYAGLVCMRCVNWHAEYRHTKPHPGMVGGPDPAIFTGKEYKYPLRYANYDPVSGRKELGGDGQGRSDPFYDYGLKRWINCALLYGRDWVTVGVYHSHPRKLGRFPSPGDLRGNDAYRRFLGVVMDNYHIETKEY